MKGEKKKFWNKRFLSILVSVLMIFGLFSNISVMADEEVNTVSDVPVIAADVNEDVTDGVTEEATVNEQKSAPEEETSEEALLKEEVVMEEEQGVESDANSTEVNEENVSENTEENKEVIIEEDTEAIVEENTEVIDEEKDDTDENVDETTTTEENKEADDNEESTAQVEVVFSINGETLEEGSDITLNEGDDICFRLDYKTNGAGNVGDTLSYKLPSFFKVENMNYEISHFSNKTEAEDGTVTLTFGEGIVNEIGGCIEVKGTINEDEAVDGTIEVTVNGAVIKVNIHVTPIEETIRDKALEKVITNCEINENGAYVIKSPVVNNTVNYQVYVNGKYESLTGVKFEDALPEGMEVDSSSITIAKVSNNKESDVTADFKDSITIEGNIINIDFKDIDKMYIVRYSAVVTEEREEYKNSVKVTSDAGVLTDTVVAVPEKEVVPEKEEETFYGSVKLTLVDKNDESKKLSGAKFMLFNSEMKKVGDVYTTDDEGSIFIDNLPEGDYFFAEVCPSEGYVINFEKINFTISKDNPNTVEVIAKNVTIEEAKDWIMSIISHKGNGSSGNNSSSGNYNLPGYASKLNSYSSKTVSRLPSTGGRDITVPLIAAGALMVMGSMLIFKKNKRKA